MICKAVIFHGPGHQSESRCDRKEPHKQHHYRGPRDDYYWSRQEEYSGFFDESPEVEA